MNSKMVLTWLSSEDKIKKFLIKWSHIFAKAKLIRYAEDDFTFYNIDQLSICSRNCFDGQKIVLAYDYPGEEVRDFRVPVSFFDDPQAYYDKILEQYKKDKHNY